MILVRDFLMCKKEEYQLGLKLKSVKVSSHAIERWNTRVGPEVDHRYLQYYFSEHLKNFIDHGRITFLKDKIILLDNEILIGFELDEKGEFIIKTFFGRISLKPLLKNLNNLYNRYILLDNVSPELIKQQSFPLTNDRYQRYNLYIEPTKRRA